MDGPGTVLAEMLSEFGYRTGTNCTACSIRKNVMNSRGSDWCRANIDLIERWMVKSAKKQKWLTAVVSGTLVGSAAMRAIIIAAIDKSEETEVANEINEGQEDVV